MVRLNKYIAQCGLCSRREADQLIESGQINVNDRIATCGMKVTSEDIVTYQGNPLILEEKKVVLAFNKPIGVTCSEKDSHAKELISDVLSYPIRVTYAGRLDKDSEGLLLLTNDGDLIQAMMKGAHCHEKEYIVKVNKILTKDFVETMEKGIYLAELEKTTRECKVTKLTDHTFSIVLTQGMNRQIRRMCQALEYEVVSLKRVRVLNITLDTIEIGGYREIVGKEKEELYRICGQL